MPGQGTGFHCFGGFFEVVVELRAMAANIQRERYLSRKDSFLRCVGLPLAALIRKIIGSSRGRSRLWLRLAFLHIR